MLAKVEDCITPSVDRQLQYKDVKDTADTADFQL